MQKRKLGQGLEVSSSIPQGVYGPFANEEMIGGLSNRCATRSRSQRSSVGISIPTRASTVLGMSRPERIEQNLTWAKAAIPEGFWPEVLEIS
jgi:hypothetical protein